MHRLLSGTLLSSMLRVAAACSSSTADPPTDTTPPPTDTTPPPGGTTTVGLQEVAAGLTLPLYVTFAPGDSGRIFIVEQPGRVRVVKDGTLLPEPFLDVTSRVSSGGERGLLGLAFSPDYPTTGRFYIHYTDTDGNTRLARYQVSANPDQADPSSGRVMFGAEQPFANHNGGQLAFGPDGRLYLGLGDGGGGGDPDGRGQSLADPLGAILRFDVSGDTALAPADNPFVDQADARPEIWSYGLRNPWRFSFDRATGDLWIADVGQNAWEEVDVARAADGGGRGLNFGWDVMEGAHCYDRDSCDRTGLTLPLLEYGHGDGCSVTGGYVYRGAAIPTLQGRYLYGDYCTGFVRSVTLTDNGATDPAQWPTLAPGGNITSFGEDAAGELYLATASGQVLKIVPR